MIRKLRHSMQLDVPRISKKGGSGAVSPRRPESVAYEPLHHHQNTSNYINNNNSVSFSMISTMDNMPKISPHLQPILTEKHLTGTELDFYGIRIGLADIRCLTWALADNICITTLSFDNCEIDDNVACELAEKIFECNSTLTSLDLSNNCIGDDGADCIARCLRLNFKSKIRALRLGGNNIGDAGSRALFSFIERVDKSRHSSQNHLELLDLSRNRIGDEGAKSAAKSLLVNRSLTSLDLTANCLTSAGVLAIASSLHRNNSIKELFVERNNADAASIEKLRQALHKSKNNNDDNVCVVITPLLPQHDSVVVVAAQEENLDNVKAKLRQAEARVQELERQLAQMQAESTRKAKALTDVSELQYKLEARKNQEVTLLKKHHQAAQMELNEALMLKQQELEVAAQVNAMAFQKIKEQEETILSLLAELRSCTTLSEAEFLASCINTTVELKSAPSSPAELLSPPRARTNSSSIVNSGSGSSPTTNVNVISSSNSSALLIAMLRRENQALVMENMRLRMLIERGGEANLLSASIARRPSLGGGGQRSQNLAPQPDASSLFGGGSGGERKRTV